MLLPLEQNVSDLPLTIPPHPLLLFLIFSTADSLWHATSPPKLLSPSRCGRWGGGGGERERESVYVCERERKTEGGGGGG
jgi:hypothetical protein